jgi:hydrogenase-4 component F
VHGVLLTLPASGTLCMLGLLAITGSPPFGPFLSELVILKAALDHSTVVAVAYLTLLAVIFIGMTTTVLAMAQGPSAGIGATRREPVLRIAPPAILAGAVLVLGIYVPPALRAAIEQAARALG